ncbi:MAG: type II secretion system protein GspE [Omnitrophica bacterium RIFCSPLOWO2_12_FULL_50_11]|nr:MAG: type II secretion system protein GspE [Omnitrophica bacterium RIFCSPLOWO2_12_FULL_50_11]
MKKPAASLADSLVFDGLVTPEQLARVQSETKRTGESFTGALRRLGLIDEKRFTSFLSRKFDIPEVEVTHQVIKPEILKLVPEPLVRKFQVLPLRKIGKRLVIAVSDPLNLSVLDHLRLRTGFDVEPMLATDSELRNAIEQYYGIKSAMRDVVETLREETQVAQRKQVPKGEADREEIRVEEAPIIKLVQSMIEQAEHERVSDIHIAPEKDKVIVRYRVDGVLREVDQYPKDSHSAVVSRIKVMTNLDISESRIPQDGRVQVEAGGQQIDLRVSVMPTIHGENVVLRLLNLKNAFVSLEALGMSKNDLSKLRLMITKPYGIALITGPTGSGKTTTLYAALSQMNSPDKNIVTIEDPVEYQLPLIRQIQVNRKVNLTFANGLRSILRQDPDVIMVGEIRDKETAEIAIQAALTGHLVFSTLHTNNAASSVTRLLDMGVEPFLVSSTVMGVIAQRLVRRICEQCRESFKPDRDVIEKVQGVGQEAGGDGTVAWYRGRGCLSCKKSGYRGRIGIFEFLVPDDELRSLILKKASSSQIEEQAVRDGMKTLRRDGLEKVASGITTIEELLRVTQEI